MLESLTSAGSIYPFRDVQCHLMSCLKCSPTVLREAYVESQDGIEHMVSLWTRTVSVHKCNSFSIHDHHDHAIHWHILFFLLPTAGPSPQSGIDLSTLFSKIYDIAVLSQSTFTMIGNCL